MGDHEAREIFQRLGRIEQQLAGLSGMLTEREKTCSSRHENMAAACETVQELRGTWKILAGIAAVVGAAAGQVVNYVLGRH